MFLRSSGIHAPKDLVGRRVGFSVTGLEDALVDQIVRSDGAAESNLKMVNVSFNLVPALLTHKVDAVVGAYRNVERVQIELQGQAVGMFEPERYGVPAFYELVLITGDRQLAARRAELARFVRAVSRGIALTRRHPLANSVSGCHRENHVSPEDARAALGHAGVAAERVAWAPGGFAASIAATVWWARRERIVAQRSRLTRDPNVRPLATALAFLAAALPLAIAALRR